MSDYGVTVMVYVPLYAPSMCVDPPPSLSIVAPISKVTSPKASVLTMLGRVNVLNVTKLAPPPLVMVVVVILTVNVVFGACPVMV